MMQLQLSKYFVGRPLPHGRHKHQYHLNLRAKDDIVPRYDVRPLGYVNGQPLRTDFTLNTE